MKKRRDTDLVLSMFISLSLIIGSINLAPVKPPPNMWWLDFFKCLINPDPNKCKDY